LYSYVRLFFLSTSVTLLHSYRHHVVAGVQAGSSLATAVAAQGKLLEIQNGSSFNDSNASLRTQAYANATIMSTSMAGENGSGALSEGSSARRAREHLFSCFAFVAAKPNQVVAQAWQTVKSLANSLLQTNGTTSVVLIPLNVPDLADTNAKWIWCGGFALGGLLLGCCCRGMLGQDPPAQKRRAGSGGLLISESKSVTKRNTRGNSDSDSNRDSESDTGARENDWGRDDGTTDDGTTSRGKFGAFGRGAREVGRRITHNPMVDKMVHNPVVDKMVHNEFVDNLKHNPVVEKIKHNAVTDGIKRSLHN